MPGYSPILRGASPTDTPSSHTTRVATRAARFDGEPEDLVLDVHGDDAAALIRALGAGPVDVFGTSGGAQIGLNLAARYPELVTALVAHEPPAIMLLDDPSAALAADKEIYDTYRHEGVDAAMQRFFAMNGLDDETDHGDAPPDFAPTAEEAETMERVSGNFEYWLAHGMIPLSVYRPDVEALRAGKTPRHGGHRRTVRRADHPRNGDGTRRQARDRSGLLPR